MRLSTASHRLPSSLRKLAIVGAAAITVTAACTPAVAVPGNPADYAVNVYAGMVARWNPCAPVHYRLNDALQPTALANVKSAVAALAKGTGITFVYDGLTSYVPDENKWTQPASLVIAFAKNKTQAGGSDYLAGGNQLGEGGFQSSYQIINGKSLNLQITKGYVAIDYAGYARSNAKVRTETLLHELGHAVGLNHAHLTSEIMYPVVSNSGPGAYSAGDLAGLKKVGRPSGCIA